VKYFKIYQAAWEVIAMCKVFRDSVNTDVPGFTLRFRSDLTFLIEQNRRRSKGYVEDFVIEGAAKMA
jgi:hypothetical protein